MNKTFDLKEFTVSSSENWRKLVESELKEKPFQSLIWKDDNGLVVEPYLTTYEQQYRIPKKQQNTWRSGVIVTGQNPGDLNNSILEALAGGAQHLTLQFDFQSLDDLRIALVDVIVDIIAIEFQANSWIHAGQIAEWFLEIGNEKNLKGKSLHAAIQVNQDMLLKDPDAMLELAHFACKNFGNLRTVVIDAKRVHESNGNDIQELAYVLSISGEIIQRMVQAGLTIDDASALMQCSFPVGTSFFGQMAKLQAMRALWSTLIRAFNPAHSCSEHCFIKAVNSLREQSEQDSFNNVLRATTSAMSAIIGDADIVSIHFPSNFSSAFEGSASRVARNIQHILTEESYFTRARNSTDGALYISQIIDQMIEKSWKLFQEIEKRGEIVDAEILLMQEVALVSEMRKSDFDTGKKVKIGVNKYQPKL